MKLYIHIYITTRYTFRANEFDAVAPPGGKLVNHLAKLRFRLQRSRLIIRKPS